MAGGKKMISKNQKKKKVLFAGMRPLFYSETNAEAKSQGWVRSGHHVEYSQNTDSVKSIPDVVKNRNYFVLSWQLEFPHKEDTCYMAHCYPYPFSRLRNYIGQS